MSHELDDSKTAWRHLKKAGHWLRVYEKIQAKFPAQGAKVSKKRIDKLVEFRNRASDLMVKEREAAFSLARKYRDVD